MWLTQCQCDIIECCMKREMRVMGEFRTQTKYKYAEGNLVDAWEIWWAQNRYELSYIKVDM